MKLPAHPLGRDRHGGASRRGSFLHIVPFDPTYKAGFAGHVPAKEVGCLLHLLFVNGEMTLELMIAESYT